MRGEEVVTPGGVRQAAVPEEDALDRMHHYGCQDEMPGLVSSQGSDSIRISIVRELQARVRYDCRKVGEEIPL